MPQPQGDDETTAAPRRRADRRPTMADVAARVGVSRALVSLVFRDAPGASSRTRERVFQVAEEIGYRPDHAARLLARGRSRTIGVMMTVHQPFQADLVEGIYPEAERLGYDILLSASAPTRAEHKAIEALLSHRCEALILFGPQSAGHELDELARLVPVVVVGTRIPGTAVDSVHTAEAHGIRQAMDHLVELGHRRIVHIDGGKESGSVERRRAYRAAMRRHGRAGHVRVIPGAHDEESGIAAGRRLLGESALPTAVLAGNDRCAIGLLHVLAQAGIDVPGDISVVGYDDSHHSQLSHIDLTTVRQDVDGMAQHAVRAVAARLENLRQEPNELILEPKLIVRGTTGPPRRQGSMPT